MKTLILFVRLPKKFVKIERVVKNTILAERTALFEKVKQKNRQKLRAVLYLIVQSWHFLPLTVRDSTSLP